MEKPRSSKSCRLRDFLPSFRPSFLSLILFCACGYLWLRNETLNDRMIALENRLNKFLREDRVVTDDPPQEIVGSSPSKPTATRLPDYKTGKTRLHCQLLCLCGDYKRFVHSSVSCGQETESSAMETLL